MNSKLFVAFILISFATTGFAFGFDRIWHDPFQEPNQDPNLDSREEQIFVRCKKN